MNRFGEYKKPYEVLDAVIDEWCDRERASRTEKGLPVRSKLELKNELGRIAGLGNGDAENSSAKGIYRLCSGETPISVEKALEICDYIGDYRFIQWIGFCSGMLMTRKAVIDAVEDLSEDGIYEEISKCFAGAGHLAKTLSDAYQSPASFSSLNMIEESFLQVNLQLEKTRLLLRELIERSLRPGTQGALWAGIGERKKDKRRSGRAGKAGKSHGAQARRNL